MSNTFNINHNPRTQKILEFSKNGDHAQLKQVLNGPVIDHVINKALKHAARFGHVQCVGVLIEFSDQGGLNRGLCEAAKYGQLECVQILSTKANPFYDNSRALRKAAEYGCAKCVMHLAPVSDPRNILNAIVGAATWGNIDCVRVLLPYTEENLNTALLFTARNGHTEALEILLPHCVLNDDLSYEYALYQAASHQHVACVKILIEYGARNSRALAAAFHSDEWEMFALLYPVSDPNVAQEFVHEEDLLEWNQRIAIEQHKILSVEVCGTGVQTGGRKM